MLHWRLHCIGDSLRCCIDECIALALADYNGRFRVDWTVVPSGLAVRTRGSITVSSCRFLGVGWAAWESSAVCSP
eukprot:6060586-Amphidinium_carterae.1